MPGSALSRRRLLRAAGASAAASVALLTGCDLDLGGTPASGRASSRPDPDVQTVEAARAELNGLIAVASRTPGHAPLVATHRAQLVALGGTPLQNTGAGPRIPVARLRHAERRAAERFTHWAATAVSGDLARVLASVSSGIRMQPVLRGS